MGVAGERGAVWFVGAAWGQRDDQLARFLREGIWQSGHTEKGRDDVLAMSPGDRIVVKATYTRKHGLPFDSRGETVGAMRIKAVGAITENLGDGRTVRVDWTPVEPPREWFLSTYRGTVHRVRPGTLDTDALIAFALNGEAQDIGGFLSRSPWKERFGPEPPNEFLWTDFYYEFARRLRPYRSDRPELLRKLFRALETVGGLGYLNEDKYADGTRGPLRDICPFTVFGTFNRTGGFETRARIARALGAEFGVEAPAPEAFVGVPTINAQNSWLFSFENERGAGNIEALWDIFEAALDWGEGEGEGDDEALFAAFDAATAVRWTSWNLTMGLFWCDPWALLSLDKQSRAYIEGVLGVAVKAGGPKGVIRGADYFALIARLEERFEEPGCPVRSFPALARAAGEGVDPPPPPGGYDVDDVIAEGCFLPREGIEAILARLGEKKNLILQGPPGTGKTWLARRLAYALMGERAPERVVAIQFHPNLSYEDFVRGWRPGAGGALDLVDGPLLQIAERARAEPEQRFVVVIEEINRGNPAQIFGEALTLLEADKRNEGDALRLSYPRTPDERFHLPPNLFVVGTMNLADRSLALVDLALRRRFAFVDLAPTLGSSWRAWLAGHFGVSEAALDRITSRMGALNETIRTHPSLGAQFRVGHSYVTPALGADLSDPIAWFVGVVRTEIGPLLREYLYDDPERAEAEIAGLLDGLPTGPP